MRIGPSDYRPFSAVAEDEELSAAVAEPSRCRLLAVLLARGEATATRPERLDAAVRALAHVAARWDERQRTIKRPAEAAHRESSGGAHGPTGLVPPQLPPTHRY